MRPTRSFGISALAVCSLLGLWSSTAQATFHLWRIDEVYSNASGTVQFIELQQPSFEFDDERFLTEAGTITDSTLGNTFTFPSDLPSTPAANSHFLVATPGYAALSGVPAPDYILPTNNFFSTSGDTITYAGFVDSLTFTSSQLPLDGLNSLDRAYGETTFTTAAASPTNFAGQTGAIAAPEPAFLGLLVSGASISLIGLRRRAR